MDLAERIIGGDQRAAARLMRLVDDADPSALPALAAIWRHAGRAGVIGITGSPGSGKSTLIDGLIALLRAAGHRVGVVAVDPTSPFTGGAILGDRVRMQRHAIDAGVFIRSLATRGSLGGLSASAGTVAMILDAIGFDRVLLETVGVGQDEVDVASHADVTVVVVPPGLGDDVQAQKAGVLEIADVLVVSKADLPDAERTARDLEAGVGLGPAGGRRPAVLRCSASTGQGMDALAAHIETMLADRAATGRAGEAAWQRTERLVADLVCRDLRREVERRMASDPAVLAVLERVRLREVGPHEAAATLLERLNLSRPEAPG